MWKNTLKALLLNMIIFMVINFYGMYLINNRQRITTQLLFFGWWNFLLSPLFNILQDKNKSNYYPEISQMCNWHQFNYNVLTILYGQPEPEAMLWQLQQVAQSQMHTEDNLKKQNNPHLMYLIMENLSLYPLFIHTSPWSGGGLFVNRGTTWTWHH